MYSACRIHLLNISTQFERVLKQNKEMNTIINSQTALIVKLQDRLQNIEEQQSAATIDAKLSKEILDFLIEGGDDIFIKQS